MLFVDSILQWSEGDTKPRRERIIWRDRTDGSMVTIDIDDPCALPIKQPYSELEWAVLTGTATLIKEDPFASLRMLRDENLSKAQKDARDQRWKAVKWLIHFCGEKLFYPEHRGSAISKAIHQLKQEIAELIVAIALLDKEEEELLAKAQKELEEKRAQLCGERSAYKFLRWYWQRGQVANALLPDFEKCGGKGKPKPVSEKKRGRQNTVTKEDGVPWGMNVDVATAETLARLYEEFYLRGKGRSLEEAYHLALLESFCAAPDYSGGKETPDLLPHDERPSFEQFRYWGERSSDVMSRLRTRLGRRFNAERRAFEGDPRDLAFGPGDLLEGDAGYGQICLVNDLDPSRRLGQPIIYFLVDVFSTMIVGMSVGLEGPDWEGYMLALENMAADKVTFCAEFGFDITPEEWPCSFLIAAGIRADRGSEFIGDNSNALTSELKVDLFNTPPYRPDLKPFVEETFKDMKAELIHELAGNTWHPHVRGDPDPRLEAIYGFYRFRRMAIKQVLHHNRFHKLVNYPLTPAMIADHVNPYAVDIWRWGMANKMGNPRREWPEVVRYHLLPKKNATVTDHGIRYKGLFFNCDTAVAEGWLTKAQDKQWPIKIALDPRKTNTIYVVHEEKAKVDVKGGLEDCWLIGTSKRFAGYDWADIQDIHTAQIVQGTYNSDRDLQAEVERLAFMKREEEAAKAAAAAANAGLSKNKQVSGMTENRQQVAAEERVKRAQSLVSKPISPQDSPPTHPDPVIQNRLTRLRKKAKAKEQATDEEKQ